MSVIGLIVPYVYYFWHHVVVPLFYVLVAVVIFAFVPMLVLYPFWALLLIGIVALFVKCTLRNVKRE